MTCTRTIAILSLLLGACLAAADSDPAAEPAGTTAPGDSPDPAAPQVATVLQDSTIVPHCSRVGPPCCSGYVLDDNGRCVIRITRSNQTVHPLYYVLSLIYSPPGKNSSVSYETGVGTAHKVDLSQTETTSFEVGVETPVVSASASYEVSSVSGSSYSVENQAVSTLSVGAINRLNDELPADDDEFVIAFGAAMRVRKESSIEGTFGSISAPDFSSATVAVVTVGQLKNPALMNSFQAALFANFAASDYAQLLSLDPRAAGTDVGDPARYAFLGNMPLTGLLAPSYDNTNTDQQTFTRNTSNDVTSGYTKTLTVKVDGSGLGVFKVSASASFAYSSTTTNTSDTSKSATVVLATDTHDCSASYSVYFDSLFNTLAFKRMGSSTQCQ
jgi:hypothetical protein